MTRSFPSRTQLPSRARLCVVVCANGLGHFKRVVRVLDALPHASGPLRLDVLAEGWQVEALRTWAPLERLLANADVNVHTDALRGSLRWGGEAVREDGYRQWLDRLAEAEPVRLADLVVSDNLAGVLNVRPDAVLMGSFLWHDVIRGTSDEAARIAEWEERLLADLRPPMLCVGDVVMPEVERVTRAVRLPWFCERTDTRAARRPFRTVLLLGGATDAVAPALQRMLHVLHAATDVTLCAPERLIPDALRGSPRVRAFGFTDAEFTACDLVIGRPGVGLLTDCVRYTLPILCFGDEDNAEMRHNAQRVEQMGIGRRIAMNDAAAAAQLLRGGIAQRDHDAWRANLAARACGGVQAAAHFISRSLQNGDDESRD